MVFALRGITSLEKVTICKVVQPGAGAGAGSGAEAGARSRSKSQEQELPGVVSR